MQHFDVGSWLHCLVFKFVATRLPSCQSVALVIELAQCTFALLQIVAVREINDSGWCLVKIGDGRSGWVPLDYLDKLDDKPPAISTLRK